jgi:hypothetical protein
MSPLIPLYNAVPPPPSPVSCLYLVNIGVLGKYDNYIVLFYQVLIKATSYDIRCIKKKVIERQRAIASELRCV